MFGFNFPSSLNYKFVLNSNILLRVGATARDHSNAFPAIFYFPVYSQDIRHGYDYRKKRR